jgi:DNA polymerase III subunit epsilon
VDNMNCFVAIDVETANPKVDSICQIGLVKFQNGAVVSSLEKLLDPEDYFDDFNSYIHGIFENDVKGCETFKDAYNVIVDFIGDNAVVSHSGFDKASLLQACLKYNLPQINTFWIDSAKVARRTWDFCRYKGYGLKKLCRRFKIELDHHDALSDAKAAGVIFCKAMTDTGMNISQLYDRSKKGLILNEIRKDSSEYQPNPDGHLYGEEVAFTGTLSIPRKDIAKIAANAGCAINTSVKKTTSIVVVGVQDLTKLSKGLDKSSKQIKAEELISQGNEIKILTENDFISLLNYQ